MRIKADDVFSKPHRMIYEPSSDSLLTHRRRIHLSAETRVTPLVLPAGHGFCNTTLGKRTRKEFVAAYTIHTNYARLIHSRPEGTGGDSWEVFIMGNDGVAGIEMDLRSGLRSYYGSCDNADDLNYVSRSWLSLKCFYESLL
ncbi:hypothetical protein CEXT_16511 [Caerostris extrusa]|uniref:Uncharacterized protein n=1 Tax=Caerostris extrusa TaxID=172846 RepID=A0AAV4RNJ7_CAEEX|nr:hypothetical protein CEXT_16511 [Caerostris extrusa]